MRSGWKISIVFGIVLLMLSSCKAISDFLDKGEVVAKVGDAKLMSEELQKAIPNGISADDSITYARQYINSWALDQVVMDVALEQLSDEELDVSAELEAYRRSLLKYRYEQLYVNQRLDTLVSEEQIEEYYQNNIDRLLLKSPIVKARFMSIPADSPMLKTIKKKMSSSKAVDIAEADSLAYSAAFRFVTWDDVWVDASIFAREFGLEASSVLASLRQGWVERTDTLGVMSIGYVTDILATGKLSPQEYCTETIKDMIISARKHELIMNLEQDLLKDARESGKLEILK